MSIRGKYLVTICGYTIICSAPNATMVRRNRRRLNSERKTIQNFVSEIKDDDVVYDVGANTGLYSLFAAKKASNGKVVSFEPYLPNSRILKTDIEKNKINNIDVFEIALTNSVGTIKFDQPDHVDIGYGSSSVNLNGNQNMSEVPTNTGDNLVGNSEIPPPNVIKIDVEGSESLVIDGLKQVMSSPDCRVVYCEVHLPVDEYRPSTEDFGKTSEEVVKEFKQLGFTVQRLYSREEEVFYKASK